MAEVKPKTDLLLLAWISGLRRQGHRHTKHTLAARHWGGREEDRPVCALGLLREIANDAPMYRYPTYAGIGALAGLSPEWTTCVLAMSDGCFSWNEIADVLHVRSEIPTALPPPVPRAQVTKKNIKAAKQSVAAFLEIVTGPTS